MIFAKLWAFLSELFRAFSFSAPSTPPPISPESSASLPVAKTPNDSMSPYVLKFYRQWEEKEKYLYEQYQNGLTPDSFRTSLSHFTVSRNFKNIQSDEVANEVIAIINSINLSSDIHHCLGQVTHLADQFRNSSVQQFNLSAASKILWLKYRSPFIIYDSRALKALEKLGHRRGKLSKNYISYYEAWNHEFHKVEPKISQAVEDFLNSGGKGNLKYMKEPWFIERVFDMYLWSIGD